MTSVVAHITYTYYAASIQAETFSLDSPVKETSVEKGLPFHPKFDFDFSPALEADMYVPSIIHALVHSAVWCVTAIIGSRSLLLSRTEDTDLMNVRTAFLAVWVNGADERIQVGRRQG